MTLPFDKTYALIALSALVVALCFGLVAVAFGDAAGRRRLRRRLGTIRDRARGVPIAAAAATRSLARRQSATPNIDRLAHRWLPRRDILAARLARTGRQISIGQFAMASAITAAVPAIALAALTRLGIVASLLLASFVGVALPHFVVGFLGKRRVAAFIALFPEAIDLMVRALRSGLPISEAVIGAAHEVADPVGAELRLVESGMRLGRDLESLLWESAKRIDAPEFRFFIIALSVQRETGGNLAETLANLSDVLRRRRQMRAKVHAMAGETRATTAILGGLPVAVMLLLMVISPRYLMPLFTDVRGIILDGFALVLFATGIFIMMKLAHFEI
ncbi:MAG TPA: type II secretion system F family protein [Stellaceae bacterium]|jgi:tight adherence protein B